MSEIISALEKDIKYFFIIDGVTGFLQFMFSESFAMPSALPINIPAESTLLRIGAVSFYIFFVSMVVTTFILSFKIKGLLPLFVILLISPFLPLFNVPYYFYYFLEIIIIISSIVSLIDTIIRSSFRALLFLPTLFLVFVGIIASYLIDFDHTSLFAPYLDYLIVSALFFAIYAITWKKIISKRSIIAYVMGIISTIPFFMLLKEIVANRYIEMLMELILPASLGITIYNPIHTVNLVYTLALVAFSIVTVIIKGNGSAGIGYFIVLTNVFFGTYGYEILFYMTLPTIGYVIMNYNEIKEGNLTKVLKKVISPTAKD